MYLCTQAVAVPHLGRCDTLDVGDTVKFGIDPIPSKYRANITDTDIFFKAHNINYIHFLV